MVFGQNLCEKQQTSVSEPYFGEVGMTHDLGWWLFVVNSFVCTTSPNKYFSKKHIPPYGPCWHQ